MRLIIGVLISLLLIGAASADHFLLGQVIYIPVGTAYLSAVNLEVPSLNSGLNTTIPNGGAATLTWDSPAASSCASSDFTVTGGSPGIGSVTVSPTATKTYTVNCGGAMASATVIVSGTRRDAAASFCAANGGGNGTSGSPWHSACINAAVGAAAAGDTVFLAAGNWVLNISEAPVNISKAINIVGAGSGNTFDAMGHPNNAGPTNLTATPGGTITAVRSGQGTYSQANSYERNAPTDTPPGNSSQCGVWATTPGGWWRFIGSNQNVFHIYFDGSTASTGSADCGVLTFYNATGPGLAQDVRVLQFADSAFTYSPEGRVSVSQSQNITFKDSVIANPIDLHNATLCMADAFQMSANEFITLTNLYLYQMGLNPIYSENAITTGMVTWNQNDANCQNTEQPTPTTGWDGTGIGPGATSQFDSGEGAYHFTINNSLFAAAGKYFGLGAGVNDPTTNGGVSDLNFTGNWLVGSHMSIDSCASHNYDPGHWTGGFNTDYQGCAPDDPNGGGQQVNAVWQPWLNCATASTSDPPNRDNVTAGYGFNATNNSVIGTTSGGTSGAAQLVATGTGIVPCYQTFGGGSTPHTGTTVNFRAHQNYLSSPVNRYVSGTETLNPSVTGNFCAGGGGTFTQTDSTTCATAGFTQAPTVAFSLGTLSGTTVPFTTTNFTSQYGAVQWLASTSPTAPLSSDTRWSSNNSSFPTGQLNTYIPPVSLTPVAHGNTVYMWVMDSNNNISAAASQMIP